MREKLPLFLLVLLLLGAGLRCIQLFHPGIATGDEALTALRSLGLMEQGRGWTPYWNGEPDVHKPPLYYWLVAAGYRILGVGEWALRLPSMALFLCVLALAYAMGRRVFDPWTGLVAALFAALHPTLASQSCVGMMDTTMIAFSLGAAWFLLRAEERPRCYLGWGLCCGLALLTKGEGAVPILPASLLYLLAVRRKAFRDPLFYAGLCWAAVVAGVWFGSQFAMHTDIFLKPHFEDMVGYRLKHSWRDTALYLKSLRYLWASWGALAPFLAAAPFLAWGLPGTKAGRREAILIALVGLVPLAMVSTVRQQMPWYMLPAVVPMALFAARILVGLVQGGAPLALRLAPCVLLAAGTFLPGVYAGPPALPGGVLAAAILAAALGLARGEKLRRTGGGVFAVGLALALAGGGLSVANPYVNMHRARDSEPMRRLAELLPSAGDVPGPMIVNFRHYPLNSLMFYARRNSEQLRLFSQRPVAPGASYAGVLVGGGCREFLQGLEVRSIAEYAGHEIIVVRNAALEPVVPMPPLVAPGAVPAEDPAP
ncbi:MAG: ArnT family glycosyltransferase [Kiritimatiellia bacterium]